MWNDPIVEEVRQAREQYATRFNFDIKAIFQDLKEKELNSGQKTVSMSHTEEDDPAIAAIRKARHEISASVGHDPYKLLEHYRKRQERHPERVVSLNTEESSYNKNLISADSENTLLPRSDLLIPQKLEKEMWMDSLFRLFEKEKEDILVKERTGTLFSILCHRYGDAVPVDEWQFAVDQCTADQLKLLIDRAWKADSLEAFDDYLAMQANYGA